MIKTVLFGAGQIGQITSRLLSSEYQVLCFADNYEGKWGQTAAGIPILSPADALAMNPDLIVLCVLDEERQQQMSAQLRDLGYTGTLSDPSSQRTFDARAAVMRLLAKQIIDRQIPGDTAELGVFRGEFSALIQAALPDRTIHLFDTFEGFTEKDVLYETEGRLSRAKTGDFSNTSVQQVLHRLPLPENAVIHKGWFPDTFPPDPDLQFSLVSLDADLYAPTKAALPLFYRQLSPGGVLLIHDVYSTQFSGCRKAVDEFCEERKLLPCPVSDLHGSAILIKPLL
ncbi:MAG: TylF/MycF/NovP-related O-methyltransferase [Eubacteriales bacterium]|nr:TylF/MycF/NovP-related O-methyltransferase [Eubacteriales bacterium]